MSTPIIEPVPVSRFDRFQLQAQGFGHSFHARQLGIFSVFDVADGVGIGDASQLGYCIPRQPLSFAGAANLCGDARTGKRSLRILGRREFGLGLLANPFVFGSFLGADVAGFASNDFDIFAGRES